MGKLGYTDYEEGYRHGRRDFAAGLTNAEAWLAGQDEQYWSGYRFGFNESQTIYRDWLTLECAD